MEIQSGQNCVHAKSSCYDVKCTNVMLYTHTHRDVRTQCHAIHACSPWCIHTNVMLYTHIHSDVHTNVMLYTHTYHAISPTDIMLKCVHSHTMMSSTQTSYYTCILTVVYTHQMSYYSTATALALALAPEHIYRPLLLVTHLLRKCTQHKILNLKL